MSGGNGVPLSDRVAWTRKRSGRRQEHDTQSVHQFFPIEEVMAAGQSDDGNSASHGYYHEVVRQMMFANGDLEDPIPSCVDLVLDMAKYQMVKALEDAWKKTQSEKRDCIMLEDVLVLFKHHKFILNRLLQFARTAESVNELKRAAPRTAKLDEEREEGSDQEDNAVPSTSMFDTNLSRMKAVVDSMNLDETADQLLETRDIAYEERKKRIAHLGDDMTQDEFLRFTEARQATFRDEAKQKSKLKNESGNLLEWLGAPQCENVVSFVVAFIGRELVAQYVGAAVAIRDNEEPNLFLNDNKDGQIAAANERVPLQVRHYNEALRRCIGWRRRKDFLFGYYADNEEEKCTPAKKLKSEDGEVSQPP